MIQTIPHHHRYALICRETCALVFLIAWLSDNTRHRLPDCGFFHKRHLLNLTLVILSSQWEIINLHHPSAHKPPSQIEFFCWLITSRFAKISPDSWQSKSNISRLYNHCCKICCGCRVFSSPGLYSSRCSEPWKNSLRTGRVAAACIEYFMEAKWNQGEFSLWTIDMNLTVKET